MITVRIRFVTDQNDFTNPTEPEAKSGLDSGKPNNPEKDRNPVESLAGAETEEIAAADETSQPDVDTEAPLETEAAVAEGSPPSEENEQEQSLSGPTATIEEEKPDQLPAAPERKNIDLTPLVRNFAACGRCSYFLAGYRVMVGIDGLETAVSNRKDPWLSFHWSHAMNDLVSRSYGIRLDVKMMTLNGICGECRRPFRFQNSDVEADTQPQFEIYFSIKS